MTRPIDTSGYAALTRPDSLGPAPQLQWIAIEQLVIDDSYQRDITKQGRGNVRAIAENFSWTFFAPVIVSPIEGGRYAIIDGQHRTTAAALVGAKEVPCALVIADRVTQAKAFRAINAQITRMHPLQIFQARLAAGDPPACRAAEMIAAADVRLLRSVNVCGPRDTLAAGTLIDLAARDAAVGALTLRCLAQNGERHGCDLLRAVIIKALFEVLVDHADWRADEERLVATAAALNISRMWGKAVSAAQQIKGATTCDQLQAALLDALQQRFAKVAA